MMAGKAGGALKQPLGVLGALGRGLRPVAVVLALCASSLAWAGHESASPAQSSSFGGEPGWVVGSLKVERFGAKDAEAMGWSLSEAKAMDEEALRLARRLEKRRGLPNAVVTMAQVEGEASSMARADAGVCRVALARGSDPLSSGLDFKRLGLGADASAQEDALEQELLHELGHCQKIASGGGFEHPALNSDQNQALGSSLFAADAGRFEGAGAASALYSEAYADAFMAIKWLEGRDFSDGAKASLKVVALFRKAQREDALADAPAGSGFKIEAHMTEEAIEMALESSDELSRMTAQNREGFVARIASQTALRMLARSGEAEGLLSKLSDDLTKGLAYRAFSLIINGKDPRYQAEDSRSALGAALERLSGPARSAALRSGRAAGVEWGRGADGLTDPVAERVARALAEDRGLARASLRELSLLNPKGGLIYRARDALAKAEAFERASKPLRLSSLKGALASADWSSAPGIQANQKALAPTRLSKPR